MTADGNGTLILTQQNVPDAKLLEQIDVIISNNPFYEDKVTQTTFPAASGSLSISLQQRQNAELTLTLQVQTTGCSPAMVTVQTPTFIFRGTTVNCLVRFRSSVTEDKLKLGANYSYTVTADGY